MAGGIDTELQVAWLAAKYGVLHNAVGICSGGRDIDPARVSARNADGDGVDARADGPRRADHVGAWSILRGPAKQLLRAVDVVGRVAGEVVGDQVAAGSWRCHGRYGRVVVEGNWRIVDPGNRDGDVAIVRICGRAIAGRVGDDVGDRLPGCQAANGRIGRIHQV